MKLANKLADIIGSWRFLVIQTACLILYILINVAGPSWARFDPFPFIFLNLLLSLQAAYTAPIILISHNRMSEYDREQARQDRANTRIILETIRKLEENLITKIEGIDE